MNIKADKEGKEAITQLCDVALKTGGIQNLAPITNILKAVSDGDKTEPKKVPVPDSVAEEDREEG